MDFPVQAYLFLIKDYFERGYYREKEEHYTVSRRGKIDWNRTVKQRKPALQGNESYYLDFVVRKNENKENGLLTLIHRYCVYESFLKLGWLFTSFLPPAVRISQNRKMLLSVVSDRLQNTFNDKNRQLFTSMISVPKQREQDGPVNFRFGTSHFEHVWERLTDRIFGIDGKAFFFPETKWRLSGNVVSGNARLEPDTIMICNGKIFVLDAKYYKFGWSGKAAHLPGSADINKQITYGEYIAENEKFADSAGNHPTVYNAFLMPYDSRGNAFPTGKPMHCIGSAVSSWKTENKTYEQVIGILLDVRYFMERSEKRSIDKIRELADLIEKNCSAGK